MDTTDLFYRCFSMNPIPAVISTIKEGIVVDVNEAFLRLAGYSRDEVIGKPLVREPSLVEQGPKS